MSIHKFKPGYPRYDRSETMKIITSNLPKNYLNFIDYLLVKQGLAPSRSEYIRWAVGNQINRDLEKLEKMDKMMKDAKKDELDPAKWVKIPNRQQGEELVKIVRRLEY